MFHKGTFPILMNYLSATKIKVVQGYVDETESYGYYKASNGLWYATELISGTLVCKDCTRKNCYEWIQNNSDKIEAAKNTIQYISAIRLFRQELNRLLNEMSD